MNCWFCGAPLHLDPNAKISFRALCEQCGMGLHCCKNCKNYRPGLPNDCAIPGIDYVPDREKNNFCEEFSILGKKITSKSSENSKKRFEDLFND